MENNKNERLGSGTPNENTMNNTTDKNEVLPASVLFASDCGEDVHSEELTKIRQFIVELGQAECEVKWDIIDEMRKTGAIPEISSTINFHGPTLRHICRDDELFGILQSSQYKNDVYTEMRSEFAHAQDELDLRIKILKSHQLYPF